MEFKIWKTIELMSDLNAENAYQKMNKRPFITSPQLDDVFPLISFKSTSCRISLVRLALDELGLTVNASHPQIVDAGAKRGLKLCTAEIIFNLRLQYADQPKEESIYAAVEPILFSADPYIFCVSTDGAEKRWTLCHDKKSPFFADDDWVVFLT